MSPTDELTDSTDWLPTSLPTFAPLDAALRCQVCKDFYQTPMITSCSHTFCSLCIRSCLTTDGKCPTCRAGDQATKLRRNWTVQELVDAFATARPEALELATQAKREMDEDKSPKRKRRRVGERHVHEAAPARQTRSSGRGGNNRVSASQEAIILDSEDDEIDNWQPEPEPEPEEPKDGLVACPMCSKRMKEELVFSHLDRCSADNDDNPLKARTIKKTPPLQARPKQIDLTASPAKHLPHLHYSLLRDPALRKKLQELGISTAGPRQLLIRRHTQWVDIFNANSDSLRPRSNRELLKDLDTWERTQGGSAPGHGQVGPTGVMRKDFDGEEWTGRHKGQFDDLIAAARAKVKSAQAKAAELNTKPTDFESKPVEAEPKQSYEGSILKEEQATSIPKELSDIEQLKTEQEAIASKTLPISTTTNTSSEPLSGAQTFLQHAAEDIPMRDVTPPPPQPSSQEQRHTAHEQRRYSISNKAPQIPTMQAAFPQPEKLANPEGTRRVPMFQVPEEPVLDNEGFGAGSMSGGG